ncbi:MAG: hypothetical protein JO372_19525 [Solirubrobacterales bacterium]|nr:hypothetical protein [Solirubrobacterales bacterium]
MRPVGGVCRVAAANPYTAVLETPTSIRAGVPRRHWRLACPRLGAGDVTHRLADAAGDAPELAASDCDDERSAGLTAWEELPHRDDLIVDSACVQCLLDNL